MLMTLVDIEGSVLGTVVRILEAGKDDIAAEGLRRAEAGVLDLVADRAGDAVGRGSIFAEDRGEWQVREDLRFAALCCSREVRQRHVTGGALVFDIGLRLGVIDGFAANAALPVGVARGIGHDTGAPVKADGNILARGV